MTDAVKSKAKDVGITPENLRFICGLNGLMVRELAEKLGCTSSNLYQVTKSPEEYPETYERLCALLPRREV